jgi:hypothetical protein
MMIINVSALKTQRVCVDHDGDRRRINKGMATMNHTLEKSKRESWRRGTSCDGEGASECLSLRYQSCHIESQSSKC